MTLLPRLLRIAAVVTAVAFVTAWALRNTHEGAGEVVGDIAWFTLLGGLLVTILLGLATAAAAVRRRSANRVAQ